MTENIEVISALCIAITGLVTAVCLGLRNLKIKRIKSALCDVEMANMTTSSIENRKSMENRKSFDNKKEEVKIIM